MEETAAAEKAQTTRTGQKGKESLLHRKYVIPFLLACVILACNQATGVNSIIGYNATILIQAGLSDKSGAFGLRHSNLRQLPGDHGRRDARGPERAQVPALTG